MRTSLLSHFGSWVNLGKRGKSKSKPEPVAQPVVEWEDPDCLMCGSRRRRTLVEAPDYTAPQVDLVFRIVQCRDCGLNYTNPRPNLATIGQFYPQDYRPHHLPSSSRRNADYKGDKDERKAMPLIGQGRLLDFGCGGGSYLERMHRQGWQVTGLDISADTAQGIRQELGFPCLVGTFPCPEIPGDSFDCVTMWHALEHVHQPLGCLQEAFRVLAPGGKVLVAVPCIDSFSFRTYGARWFGLELPRHLTHFTPPTLAGMMQRAGFDVESVRQVKHGNWLRYSARLTWQANPWMIHHLPMTIKHVARLAALYCLWTRQCDCILATGWKR